MKSNVRQENFWVLTSKFLMRPYFLIKDYQREDIIPDLMAGLTIAVVMLPQAIAYALVAELPPQMGIYTAIVGSIIGGLWGSSALLISGPTNTSALLVLAVLLPIAPPGSSDYILAASLLAVLVGVFQMTLGFARLGMLVSFVSDSVIVGFTAGAGVLIAVNQIKYLLELQIPTRNNVFYTFADIVAQISDAHLLSIILGLAVILLLIVLRWINSKMPATLIVLGLASLAVWAFQLDKRGLVLIAEIPRSLPPLATLPPIKLSTIGELSSGVLAIGSIGLVQTMAIAKVLSTQTRKRFDSNQEFVGQGLANIVSGLFSGYVVFGSFVRSAVNSQAGGRSAFSGVFAGILMMLLVLLLAPLIGFIPKAALAGVLIVIAIGMIDKKEILRIWRGAKSDLFIMAITFVSVLFLPLQFAVLLGILTSFAVYILRTSTPRIFPVLPSDSFEHLVYQPDKEPCPQMAVFDLHGDLYFGSTRFIEDRILDNMSKHPTQRYLLLRMNNVNQCDISGIHTLENIVRQYRQHGGDVLLINTQPNVIDFMVGTGFYQMLGEKNFIFDERQAISYAFYHLLDPVVCIYECERRVFYECQNLPKHIVHEKILPLPLQIPPNSIDFVPPRDLWNELHSKNPPLVIDVREPREYRRGHIPQAISQPLFGLISHPEKVPKDKPVVFVCRSGRRSGRAAYYFLHKCDYQNIRVLKGGMQAWDEEGLLNAVELFPSAEVTNG